MAVTFKPGFDRSETTRGKSFGGIIICIYISVIFILLFFIGFFALRTSEDDLQDSRIIFLPCSFNSDEAFHFHDSWMKTSYCPPAHNIFFLKTHKCASSTVQNILMRYGDERNLSFVLPKTLNYMGHPEIFSKRMIFKPKSQPFHFNILCHHLRFNDFAVQEIMPPTTIYISILRNPVTLFRSMYDYYNMSDLFNKTIEDFIQDDRSKAKLNYNRMYQKLGRNQMLFDMGYDRNIWENETLIREAIYVIDKTFHLIMIQELFDESLILLKHKLCWSMPDIVYLKHNMRTQIDVPKNDSVSLKIESYNAADKMLYDYFFQKLNLFIDSFGRERMAKEVQDFRLWNSVWFNHCVKRMASLSENVPTETKAYNSKVYSFVLNDEPIADLCKRLAMEELQYTDILRNKQTFIQWRL